MEKYMSKKWILFGAGNSKVLTYLTDYYHKKILYIVDNDNSKHGTYYNGLKILPIDSILTENKENTVVIITTYKHWDEIENQLQNIDWGENYIIARRDIHFFDSYEYYLYCAGVSLKTSDFNPVTLHIELSGICNCKCIYCPFHGELNLKKDQKKLMTWDTLKKVVQEVKRIGTIRKLNTTGAGEIFVHPEWYEMLQYYLNEIPTEYINIYTNGMLLTRENIIKISKLNARYIELEISIDGRTSEENDFYRVGSKYSVIKKNIEMIEQLKYEGLLENDFYVVLTNCYILNENETKSNNYKFSNKNTTIPGFLKRDFTKYNIIAKPTYVYYKPRYKENLKTFNMFEISWPDNYENRCKNLFSSIAINNEGKLLKCSCGCAGIETIGDIFYDDVLQLWKNNKEMNRARKHFIDNDPSSDFCEGCPQRGMGKYYIMLNK